jgi:hypothetical protein
MSDTAIVAAVSALVVQILEADQGTEFAVPVAPLSSGRIELGRQFVNDRTAPSQVVFVPVRSRFGPPATKSQTVQTNGVAQGFQSRMLRRPLGTDLASYEVHVWAQHNPADPEKDFDATRYLAHVVMQACQLLAMSSVLLSAGEWTDQRKDSPQLVKAGHRFEFGVEIHLPILDSSVQFPPPGTIVQPSVVLG